MESDNEGFYFFLDGINERFQDTLSDLHRTRSQLHYPSQYLQRYNSTSSGGAAADIGAKKAMNYSPYGSVGPSPYNKVFFKYFS